MTTASDRWLALTVLLGLGLAWLLSGVTLARDTEADRVSAGIWKIARREAEAHPERLIGFTYERSKTNLREFYFDLGIQDASMMGLDLKDPLEAALVFATHAEGLETRLRKIAKEKIWREALDDYRKDVDKLLRLAHAGAKASKIKSARAKVETGRHFVRRAIERHVNARGMELSPPFRSTTTTRVSAIKIKTDPPGGIVRMLPRLRYQTLVLLKVPEAKMPWRTAKYGAVRGAVRHDILHNLFEFSSA